MSESQSIMSRPDRAPPHASSRLVTRRRQRCAVAATLHSSTVSATQKDQGDPGRASSDPFGDHATSSRAIGRGARRSLAPSIRSAHRDRWRYLRGKRHRRQHERRAPGAMRPAGRGDGDGPGPCISQYLGEGPRRHAASDGPRRVAEKLTFPTTELGGELPCRGRLSSGGSACWPSSGRSIAGTTALSRRTLAWSPHISLTFPSLPPRTFRRLSA